MATNDILSNPPAFKGIGNGTTSGAELTLPAEGNNFILYTGHNSYADVVSLWALRVSGNLAVHLGGGTNLTVTVSGRTVTVTTGRGSVTVSVLRIG